MRWMTPLMALLTLTAWSITQSACGSDPTSVSRVEDCTNGLDDDGDGLIDCQDPLCASWSQCRPPQREVCDNGLDDNRDKLIDCADPQCAPAFGCVARGEDCANGLDDDGDGLIDCHDPACAETATCKIGGEGCANGTDDDGDGFIDCDDPACQEVFICLARLEVCDSGQDDDGDSLTDCDDPDCANTATCKAGGEDCSNGADDDGDGLVDCADADCAFTRQCLVLAEDCANGVDDNGDGLTDCADPQCTGRSACGTSTAPARCSPGALERGACGDPACAHIFRCLEICDNGEDDNADGDTDCEDERCALTARCLDLSCGAFGREGLPEPADELDNGFKGCQDSACRDEPLCQPVGGTCFNPARLLTIQGFNTTNSYPLAPLREHTSHYDLSQAAGGACDPSGSAQQGADQVFQLTIEGPGILSAGSRVEASDTTDQTSTTVMLTPSLVGCHLMDNVRACERFIATEALRPLETFGLEVTYPQTVYLTLDSDYQGEDESASQTLALSFERLPERCDNGEDDNGDGLIDCADPQCDDIPACLESYCQSVAFGGQPEIKANFNGAAVCADPRCATSSLCVPGASCFAPIDITQLFVDHGDEQRFRVSTQGSRSHTDKLASIVTEHTPCADAYNTPIQGTGVVYKVTLAEPRTLGISNITNYIDDTPLPRHALHLKVGASWYGCDGFDDLIMCTKREEEGTSLGGFGFGCQMYETRGLSMPVDLYLMFNTSITAPAGAHVEFDLTMGPCD